MDHVKILRRALHITWRYRALWIFGALVAFLSGGGGGGQGLQYSFRGEDLNFERGIQIQNVAPLTATDVLAIIIALACLTLIFVVIATIIRYVAETALIRLVDHHETTGEKLGIRSGFRLGWSRTAFRFFLLDLVVGLPVAVAFILLFLLALSPLLLWATDSRPAAIAGTVAAIGLVLLVIAAAILASIAISLLMRFFRRACALEGIGARDAIRQGMTLVRHRAADVLILALLMFGLGVAYALISIPIGIALVIVAAAVGAIPGVLAGWLTSLVSSGALPWIIGIVVGVPTFFVATLIPGLLIGGMAEVYQSSVWTLAYRELRSIDSPQPQTA